MRDFESMRMHGQFDGHRGEDYETTLKGKDDVFCISILQAKDRIVGRGSEGKLNRIHAVSRIYHQIRLMQSHMLRIGRIPCRTLPTSPVYRVCLTFRGEAKQLPGPSSLPCPSNINKSQQ